MQIGFCASKVPKYCSITAQNPLLLMAVNISSSLRSTMAMHALGQSKIKQECAKNGEGRERRGRKERRKRRRKERRERGRKGTLQLFCLNIGRIRSLIISSQTLIILQLTFKVSPRCPIKSVFWNTLLPIFSFLFLVRIITQAWWWWVGKDSEPCQFSSSASGKQTYSLVPSSTLPSCTGSHSLPWLPGMCWGIRVKSISVAPPSRVSPDHFANSLLGIACSLKMWVIILPCPRHGASLQPSQSMTSIIIPAVTQSTPVGFL